MLRIRRGSQFYIVLGKSAASLDGRYTVFGQVIEGQSAANSMHRGDRMLKVSVTEPAPPVSENKSAGNKPSPDETPKKG